MGSAGFLDLSLLEGHSRPHCQALGPRNSVPRCSTVPFISFRTLATALSRAPYIVAWESEAQKG